MNDFLRRSALGARLRAETSEFLSTAMALGYGVDWPRRVVMIGADSSSQASGAHLPLHAQRPAFKRFRRAPAVSVRKPAIVPGHRHSLVSCDSSS